MRSPAAATAALSLVASSVASAAPANGPVNPLVALSIFGSSQSRTSLCVARSAAIAGSASTPTKGDRRGCVLPVLDPAAAAAAPVPSAAPNLTPLLFSLGAFAAIFFLLDDAILGHGGDFEFDRSPS